MPVYLHVLCSVDLEAALFVHNHLVRHRYHLQIGKMSEKGGSRSPVRKSPHERVFFKAVKNIFFFITCPQKSCWGMSVVCTHFRKCFLRLLLGPSMSLHQLGECRTRRTGQERLENMSDVPDRKNVQLPVSDID